ncbi:MAG: DUF2267 domain-containing protein [Sphingobacteriales bacterium]|jgi:uncharacterized protein (DUF2267 family)
MSSSGLPVFDETVQLSNVWLNELMEELGWKDKKRAYRVLRATLHALRDRLTPHEAIHLGAQLPMLIRGFYYEGWHMKETAPPEHTKQAFFDHVHAELRDDPGLDTERPVREVFKLLARKISPGEVEDVKHILPAEVRALWPNGATV